MSDRRRWVRPLVGGLVAVAFVLLLARRVDWRAATDLIVRASPAALAAGLALLALGYSARIVRWWTMLRAFEPRLPVGACARPFLASLAVNNTVPFRAGDIVRAFGFQRDLGIAPARVVGTLVLERVLDLLVLLLLFFPGLIGVARGAVPPSLVVAGAGIGTVAVVLLLLLVLAPGPVGRLIERLCRLGPLARRPLAGRAAGWAAQFLEAFAPLRSGRRAAELLMLSLVAWGFEGGMYAMVAHAVQAGSAPAGPWFALTTGTLATLIPSSPGYVGTFDYFAMLGLTAYGARRTAAAAFALLVHLMLWLPVTVIGGLYALAPRARAAWSDAPRVESV